MKYNVIGDIHGQDVWKKLVMDDAINIFMGDYFCPYKEIPFEQERQNFLDIIEYKKSHPDNCILLIGNHDICYWKIDEIYTRHEKFHEKDICKLFKEYGSYLQMAYSIENVGLATHAGVSWYWYVKYAHQIQCFMNFPFILEEGASDKDITDTIIAEIQQNHLLNKDYWDKVLEDYSWCVVVGPSMYIVRTNADGEIQLKLEIDRTPDTVAEQVNRLWQIKPFAFDFETHAHTYARDGDTMAFGPCWIRLAPLLNNNLFMFSNYFQTVGHTRLNYVKLDIKTSENVKSPIKNICKDYIIPVDLLDKQVTSIIITTMDENGLCMFEENTIKTEEEIDGQ